MALALILSAVLLAAVLLTLLAGSDTDDDDGPEHWPTVTRTVMPEDLDR